ncbi:CKP2L protein, partial [Galbula dea]|nr:CKP2L protein [Galbula dea]
RKQLEEWLASKGKTYKRPPMALLQKNPAKLSCRSVKQREKKENPEQLSLEKTNNILTECLKLTEEGVQAAKVLAVLSRLPQAEKFAKFWICKAKLLARSGPSDVDVMELYDAAVRAGAAPLEELRELVLDILKAADEKSEVVQSLHSCCSMTFLQLHCLFPLLSGEKAELPGPSDPTPCQSERQHVAATPCLTGRPPTGLPVSIKLRITPAYREKKLLECQKLKFLTPVRRSQRIEQNSSLYPEMLKDHDPLVASLREILDAEEGAQFIFQKNKAL